MAQYRVVHQRVEINGISYMPGDILDETQFRPATDTYEGELDSLLGTDHVELVV